MPGSKKGPSKKLSFSSGPDKQLFNQWISAYESKGRKFESCRAHLKTKDLQIQPKSKNPKKVA
jgi:hypothetical protein